MKPPRSHRPPPPEPARPLKAAQKVAATAAQEVRIIGGRWKRTPLTVPTLSGLRPTPSRVRETLFNWLGQDLSAWRVLDAFAGSGALGFEAASRGAQSVCMIEREPTLVKSLRAMQVKLSATEVQVVQADALVWMQRLGTSEPGFDLILLDPPFDDDLSMKALTAASPCVPVGGWIYLESPEPFGEVAADAAGVLPGLRIYRQGRAGAVHYHLFQRVDGLAGVSLPTAGD